MDPVIATHAERWFGVVSSRRSRRRYDGTAPTSDQLDALDGLVDSLRPVADARAVVLREVDPRLFTGLIGGYGRITGAPCALAIIASRTGGRAAERHAGHLGEAAILEATALGLDTCWVGGFFDPDIAAAAVHLSGGEQVVAVSPLGHAIAQLDAMERSMRKMARSHQRKPLAEIAPGIDDSWPAWARAAVECARLAPSAMNRQPWRFRYEDGDLVIARDSRTELPRVSKALDCGIATLHAEIAAFVHGRAGSWIDLDDPLDIARFVPEE